VTLSSVSETTEVVNHLATVIHVHKIKDPGAQMRVEVRAETINDYAEAMLSGADFPAVILYHDGTDYWLGDGYHRVAAARKIERETIKAEVREGTARDAILCGVGANATHGLQRTQADKRQAVERLLRDAEWARWSDRKVADAAKVDHKTVAKIRRELSGEIPTVPGKLNREIPTRADNPARTGKPNGSLVADV
jgi:ParB-like nuclease domain